MRSVIDWVVTHCFQLDVEVRAVRAGPAYVDIELIYN